MVGSRSCRDTVASVGLIPRYLPFTSNNTGVRYLRHALALDEHRVKFIPSFCVDGKPDGDEKVDDDLSRAVSATAVSPVTNGNGNGKDSDVKKRKKQREMTASQVYEREINKNETTDVQEVWFSGVHCGM